MFELKGQKAIVTGAATGIGEAIARRLGRAGATVIIADLNLEDAQSVATTISQGAFAIMVDVSSAGSIKGGVAEVLKRTGQIDVLVNNAGIAGPAGPIWEQTDDVWQKAVAI